MTNAAQYSFGLFDTTALGWTLDAPRATPTQSTDPTVEPTPCVDAAQPATRIAAGKNYRLNGERILARSWSGRALDNIRAITLSKEIEDAGRAASREEQEQLLRFIGFGATDLAQNAFLLPGAWLALRRSLPQLYSSLQIIAATSPASTCQSMAA